MSTRRRQWYKEADANQTIVLPQEPLPSAFTAPSPYRRAHRECLLDVRTAVGGHGVTEQTEEHALFLVRLLGEERIVGQVQAEAIRRAEAIRGLLPSELLDFYRATGFEL